MLGAQGERIFFSSAAQLPQSTPAAVAQYRHRELNALKVLLSHQCPCILRCAHAAGMQACEIASSVSRVQASMRADSSAQTCMQGLEEDGSPMPNKEARRQRTDRIYDYQSYNDLGNPEKSPDLTRPTLGGSAERPFPRRLRSGRPLLHGGYESPPPAALREGPPAGLLHSGK
jgi:hypothetical protein